MSSIPPPGSGFEQVPVQMPAQKPKRQSFKEAMAERPSIKDMMAEKDDAREAKRIAAGKPIAKFSPGVRAIKLYADGRIESPWGNGSVVGAVARVDQSGSKRLMRDTRQVYLTIEGPELAISVKMASNNTLNVSAARKFAAKVNQMAQSGATTAPTAAVTDVPDQIRKLAELRDLGILTDDEFEAKKTDLLAKL